MKKLNTNGRKAAGATPGAGYQNKRVITIDDVAAGALQELGKGNLSAGVRKAAAIVQTLKKEVNAK